MRFRTRTAALLALAVGLSSCGHEGPTAPGSAVQIAARGASSSHLHARISEFHYDNEGTDTGEAIEISAPAGTDVTGWRIVLYNGANGLAYHTATLSGTVPATCDARGVVVQSYPVNGIQNGSPDGIALVTAANELVEFLSYEGTFTALDGPAAGVLSVDVGVAETSTTPIGHSLQRNPGGTWDPPAAATFGACNDGTGDEEPAEIARVEVSPEAAAVEVGATVALSASAFDASDAPVAAAFTWSSRDAGIATVDAAGTVTGVAVGNVRIVAAVANGVADSATITVESATPPPALPPVRFSEIHYDNFGTDANEAIEIEGPAGTDVTGWSIVLYNGNGGAAYDTQALSGVLPDQCSGRGTLYTSYPPNGIQNGAPDGMALVDDAGDVIEFLSYEGTFVATGGPAAGMLSADIGVAQNSAPVGRSLQRAPSGIWSDEPATFGVCFGQTPPPPPSTISFSGRTPSDAPLPVGFEDQLFATLRDGAGVVVPTTFTWTSETPAIASIDARGVLRALAAGTAVLRATAEDGTTGTHALPTAVATPSLTAQYLDHVAFGTPADADASDDILVHRTEFVSSFHPLRNIPNWVAYNLNATHFGGEDRCDCFTYDPDLPPALTRYNTADYTGAGAAAGYGIDRGHLARSFDRTGGALDNARSFYFTNIVPQAADNNQGPWAQLENHLGDLARFSDRELYIVAGVSGSKGTIKDEGLITIPAHTWKVAVILPRGAGLADVGGLADLEVLAVIMPNDPGIRNIAWQSYVTTVDAVEALSGYDLLSLLRDDIEIAVESGTVPPDAALDGPYDAYAGDPVAMSGAGSSDADGHALAFAWDFGDGSTATGVTTSHTFTAVGSYTVRLIATDVLGLADTVSTSANITPLPPLVGLERAIAFVTALQEGGALGTGNARSLLAKLDAALQQLARGNTASVAGQVQATLNEIEALVAAGRLGAAQVEPIRDVLRRVLEGLRG
jgi:DNA/RNA endonuclease G (NUC1)